MKELNEYTKQNKKCTAKILHKKQQWLRFEPSSVTVPHINSSHAFTMLLTSELCDTLVIQRHTSIIVIVAFDAGIEAAGSITIYLIFECVFNASIGGQGKILRSFLFSDIKCQFLMSALCITSLREVMRAED